MSEQQHYINREHLAKLVRECGLETGEQFVPVTSTKAAHGAISALALVGVDAPTRARLHRGINGAAVLTRAVDQGYPDEIVLGFYAGDDGFELSLFGDEFEWAPTSIFTTSGETPIGETPMSRLKIGYTTSRAAVTVTAIPQFLELLQKLSAAQGNPVDDAEIDVGWVDHMGRHIEYYEVATGEYVRESATGRHSYTVRIDDLSVEVLYAGEATKEHWVATH